MCASPLMMVSLYSICGHSGAGKSTLFKLLTHEVTPDSGYCYS